MISSAAIASEKVHSKVDLRVEMLSIIFRLAGNPEYNMKFAKNYVADIHAYFDSYKNEPVVNFAKELSGQKNMGFSKVMFLAVHLKFQKDQFILIKESESNLIGKWDDQDIPKFIKLLNNFYHKTKFQTFFNAHQQQYHAAINTFDQAVDAFDQQWYLDYYGDKEVSYSVYLGLGDGGANYGPSVTPINQKRLVYAIMGSWTFDQSGNPQFPKDIYLTYLIHEFNHSFVDHILEENMQIDALLKTSGMQLLQTKKDDMKKEGYEDWHSLINESLVRASVVRYMIDHKNTEQEIEEEIQKQQTKGFTWIRNLVSLLGQYESSRQQYPTFKSFYPKLITFFKEEAQKTK